MVLCTLHTVVEIPMGLLTHSRYSALAVARTLACLLLTDVLWYTVVASTHCSLSPYILDHATAMLASAFTVWEEWQHTHYITAMSVDTGSTYRSQLDVWCGEVHTPAHMLLDL